MQITKRLTDGLGIGNIFRCGQGGFWQERD